MISQKQKKWNKANFVKNTGNYKYLPKSCTMYINNKRSRQ